MTEKNKLPQEILPRRRSTRTKTSALANKFGNAIAINNVDNANTAGTAVCNITIQRLETKETEPTPHAAGITHETSTDIECIEISTNQGTPEQLRIEETSDGPNIQNCASIRDTNDAGDNLFTPMKTATRSDSPQNDPGENLLTTANTSKRPESPKTPTQRAISFVT